MHKDQWWTPAHFRIWAAWQAEARKTLASRIPHIVDYGSALWARCSAAYQHVQALPRWVRRALQHTLAPSLAQVALILVLGAGAAQAATINVAPNVTDIDITDGACSLIEAMVNANNDAPTYADCIGGSGADTLVLASNSTHSLTSVNNLAYGPTGLPLVTSPITIEGHGSTIMRDPSQPDFRLLAVSATGDLTLQELTLKGGVASDISSSR